jgi:hypothetical protein
MNREISPGVVIAVGAVALCVIVLGWLWYSGTFKAMAMVRQQSSPQAIAAHVREMRADMQAQAADRQERMMRRAGNGAPR